MRQYGRNRPEEAEACGLGPCRRDRPPHGPPERQGVCRRPPDGRNQPRWQAWVYWTNSLSIPRGTTNSSSRRSAWSRGHGHTAGPAGGLELAKDYWVDFLRDTSSGASDPTSEGGDCSTDSFCYPFGLTGSGADWAPAGLWLAVIASGLYHGVNPGMGWPLAVLGRTRWKSARVLTRPRRGVRAAHGWPSARNSRGDPSLLAAGRASSIGSGRSRSAPVSLSSGSVSSGLSTVTIRGRLRGYDRRNSDSGPLP